MIATPSSFAPFDPEPAIRVLTLLGKDPALTRLRFFPHKLNPRKKEIGAGKKVSGLPAATIEAEHRQERGAYFVVNNGGDTAASITECIALFNEWDDMPIEWQRSAWRTLNLPEPSLQIETGGASIHSYWILKEPIGPDEWRLLQKRLIDHGNSDDKIKDPSRVMRLPGAWYIGADGQPVAQTRITHASDRRYSVEEVMANVGAGEERPAAQQERSSGAAPSQSRGQYPPRTIEQVMDALNCYPTIAPKTKQRDNYRDLAWGLREAVREAGGDDALALELIEAHSPGVVDAAEYLKTEPHTIGSSKFFSDAYKLHGWRTKKGDPDPLAGFEVLEDEVGAKREEKAQGGAQQQEKTKEPPKPPQPRKSWEERNKRKLSHTRAMRCFDRCVEVQAQQQRNSLTRRARLLKALHDLGLSKYVNRAEISQKVLEAKDRQQGRCFKAITRAERMAMERPTVSWLIPGILPDRDASIIGGRAKVGKTRLAYALAAAVLTGKPVFGFEAPAPRPVIVISDDQGDGDTADMLTELGIWDHPNLIWSRHFRLTESDLDQALLTIKEYPGALLIFDSLRSISRSLQEGENDPEIGAIIYDLKEAVVEAGGAPVLIHHCNKADGQIGMEALSGHNAIAGAANTILTVTYLPDEKGKPQKDDQQRRLHREARSGKAFDLVIAPAAHGTFERVAEFGEWASDQKKASSEQEALGKMPTVNVKILAVLCSDREKWFTRREVCEARGVPWGDRGRGPEVQKVTRALQRLVKENFAESQRDGQEASFRAAGGGGAPHMGQKSDDTNDSDAIQ